MGGLGGAGKGAPDSLFTARRVHARRVRWCGRWQNQGSAALPAAVVKDATPLVVAGTTHGVVSRLRRIRRRNEERRVTGVVAAHSELVADQERGGERSIRTRRRRKRD